MASSNSNTVIIGAGIIGCSTAYYLSQSLQTPAQSIHLVETSDELFKCASGFAGGFLAADWFSTEAAPLGALSFDLHRKLAEEHNGKEKWGYSSTTSTSLDQGSTHTYNDSGVNWLGDGSSRANAAAETPTESQEGQPVWLTRRKGDSLEVISSPETTAQVDPLRLSNHLLQTCLARGIHLHHPARALSLTTDIRDALSAIRILDANGVESDIPCTRLILTAGAWTPRVFHSLFPESALRLPITSLAGHSLILRSPRWTQEAEDGGCHAVFTTDEAGLSPEMFSRRGEEIYIAGLNDACAPLPDRASDVVADAKSIETLKNVAEKLLGMPGAANSDLELVRESLCFRPVGKSGEPIVGRVPDEKLGGVKTRGAGEGGVFVAAGHGPWGITQSLGTGFVMAELIEGREPSVDIGGLSVA